MTARLAQHRRKGDGNPYRNSIQHTAYSIQRDPRTFEFAAEGREPCKQQAYSISTHRDPRTSLAKAGMGMDGNHACKQHYLAL